MYKHMHASSMHMYKAIHVHVRTYTHTPVALPVFWVETCTVAALPRVALAGASWTVTMAGLVPSEDMYTACVNWKMASVGEQRKRVSECVCVCVCVEGGVGITSKQDTLI